ncbi:hypothetical protein [Halomicrococcus gelatinilyticus]|uniref:hypothetical protein n=1 Tax=Halomicrococcus gelatinilyticus TaxID=1702103 RepID=UPI002E0FE438
MAGIELRDGTLVVERSPNELDELAISFSRLLTDLDIEHVYISGYVAILAGRSRATQDIDILLERIDEPTVERLVERLQSNDYWGASMPLDDMYTMLSNGDNIWVAPEGEVIPHLEVKFVDDEFDRASLKNSITAEIGDVAIPIGPLELQIAYKLYLSDKTSFEDAVHLYTLFGESLRRSELERWVTRLSVEDEYERLKRT